jgi:predicted acylesterase/phospholipase RssA
MPDIQLVMAASLTSKRTKTPISKRDIQYLALEGGGGKGIVYKGMVSALEELGLLPIVYEINSPPENEGQIGWVQPKSGQIKGIAGSSAGAITALALAIGMNWEQLNEAVTPDAMEQLNSDDDYKPNKYRRVVNSGSRIVPDEGEWEKEDSFIAKRFEKVKKHLVAILDKALPFEVSKTVTIVSDLGYYCGFGVRRFISDLIDNYFIQGDLYQAYLMANPGLGDDVTGGTLTFQEFFDITGFDLRITGTNLSNRLPLNFTREITPNFPIAEAVAISMSIPGYFKPVEVGEVDRVSLRTSKELLRITPNTDNALINRLYSGLWVDGGYLNNLPIHAFDHTEPGMGQMIGHHFDRDKLHPGVLGMRLEDGFDPDVYRLDTKDGLNDNLRKFRDNYDRARIISLIKGGSLGKAVKEGMKKIMDILGITPFERFRNFLLLNYGTMMYPAEEGQIRSEAERQQTVSLYAGFVTTFDFAPKVYGGYDKTIIPIEDARKKILSVIVDD